MNERPIDFTDLLNRLTDAEHRAILTNMNSYPVDSTLSYYARLYNALLELDHINETGTDPDYPDGLTD